MLNEVLCIAGMVLSAALAVFIFVTSTSPVADVFLLLLCGIAFAWFAIGAMKRPPKHH